MPRRQQRLRDAANHDANCQLLTGSYGPGASLDALQPIGYEQRTTQPNRSATGRDGMMELAIQFSDEATKESCALCGTRTASARGPQLCRAHSTDVICRKCGKAHAPALVALLDLAQTAERVGRIGQHTFVPPITALLDLARAAENYTVSTPNRCRQAA